MVEHKRALGQQGEWHQPGDATPKSVLSNPIPPLLAEHEVVSVWPRRFVLNRTEDVTGTSGTGIVAEGVQFTDGVCVMRWVVARRSTVVYDSVDDLIAIHGHQGATQLLWADQ